MPQTTPDDAKCHLRIWAQCDPVFDALLQRLGVELEPLPVWIPQVCVCMCVSVVCEGCTVPFNLVNREHRGALCNRTMLCVIRDLRVVEAGAFDCFLLFVSLSEFCDGSHCISPVVCVRVYLLIRLQDYVPVAKIPKWVDPYYVDAAKRLESRIVQRVREAQQQGELCVSGAIAPCTLR